MSTWFRLLRFAWPYRVAIGIAIASMMVLAGATALYPVLLELLTTLLFEGSAGAAKVLGPVVSRVSALTEALGFEPRLPALGGAAEEYVAWFFAAVVVAKTLSQATRFYFMGSAAQRVVLDLRQRLFEALLGQGSAFFGREASGFLVSRLINDVAQVERAVTYAIPILFGDALRVLTLAAVCLVRYPELSLVAVVVLPVAVLPIVQFGRWLKRYARQGQEALGQLTHRATESLGGIRVVHVYGREAYEAQRFRRAGDWYLERALRSVLVRAVQTPLMELVGVGALVFTMLWAKRRVDAGELGAGEVLAFLLALVLLYEPLKAIGRLNAVLLPGVAAAERVFEVIDHPPEIEEPAVPVRLAAPLRSVRFEQVGFTYPGTTEPALVGLELELAPGRLVALVGSSGSGKSTAASLLPRLWDVTAGRITIDGVDIRALALADLRARIALVSQDTYLFHDNLRANIAYGRPDASEAQIEEAAKNAFAHGFISALPAGYSTEAGERGVTLSGGQRQRIAIARAFLRDAPILILDEATSALDVESELEVQHALDRLLENRAALVIAHRLSTIARADEIVVLEAGRVVERGRHAELLAREGAYARYVRAGALS